MPFWLNLNFNDYENKNFTNAIHFQWVDVLGL